jgi:CHAD domain-containing protein
VSASIAPQFRLPPDTGPAALVARLRELLPFRVREDAARNVNVTLLDTFDWRIFESGGYLELEATGKRRQLTWWSADESELRESCPVGALPRFATDLPPGHLREVLAPLLDVRALVPLVQMRGRVHPLDVLDGESKTVLRLTVEEHRVQRPGHRPGPWLRRLRIFPVKGYPEPVRAIADLASGTLGLARAETLLFVDALAAVGRRPRDYDPRLAFQLAPDMRADAALQVILRKLLETVLANEDGVRRQVDTEFLHDLRVAVRRARSLLGQVRKVFPDRVVSGLREDLGWLGRASNDARDMDVYLLAFDGYSARLPEPTRAHLEPFRAFLLEHQTAAYGELGTLLSSGRFHRLVERWRALALRDLPGRPTSARARNPVAQVARKRIWRAYREVMKQGKAIRPGSPARALHAVRIACKKLRYLMEFFRSLYPPEAIGELIKALKAFQDNLGEMQDLHVQQEQLTRFERAMAGEGRLQRETRDAMERLIESLAERQAEVREEFGSRFAAFSAPETVAAFRGLFQRRARKDREGQTP